MSTPGLLDRIRSLEASLSPAERRVAQVALHDPRGFATQPIGRLAERAGVSKPTVLRFCRSLGFAGLPPFKHELAAQLPGGLPYVHRALDAADHPHDVVSKLIDAALAAISEFRASVSAAAVMAAAERIGHARRIECFGVGNSGIVAQDAQHKLFQLGLNAHASCDPHVQVMAATQLGAGDCVLAISNSGRSRDVLEALAIASAQGAATIAITASGTPLAQAAQILLAVDHREDPQRFSPMLARLLHLLVIDLLTTAVALQRGPDAQTTLAEIKQQLGRLQQGS